MKRLLLSAIALAALVAPAAADGPFTFKFDLRLGRNMTIRNLSAEQCESMLVGPVVKLSDKWMVAASDFTSRECSAYDDTPSARVDGKQFNADEVAKLLNKDRRH